MPRERKPRNPYDPDAEAARPQLVLRDAVDRQVHARLVPGARRMFQARGQPQRVAGGHIQDHVAAERPPLSPRELDDEDIANVGMSR